MPIELIATLFLQLTDIYGSRFVNQYGEKDSGVWYQALCDLEEEAIRFGLHAVLRDARFETWPPNCTQFRHLCLKRPAMSSVPTVHQAFSEARANLSFSTARAWSHPAVKFTVKHLSVAKVLDARADRAFAAFSTLYEVVCKRLAEGHTLPHVADEELVVPAKRSNPVPRLAQILR